MATACATLVVGAALAPRASAAPGPSGAAADTVSSEAGPAPLLIPGRPNPADSAVIDPARQARGQFAVARGLETKYPTAAILTYRKALRLDPSLRDANYRIGLLFNTRAQWAEAAKCFAAELQKHPDHLDAAREKALALARTGDGAGAIRELEALSRSHPRDGRMWHALGFAYSSAGRAREAEKAIRRAIALPPPDVEEHRDLGALLASLGREREARVEYRRALAVRPLDPATWFNLGNLEHRAGHRDSALICYRRAVAADSSFSIGYRGQVQLLRESDRADDAAQVYRVWLARRPDEHGTRLEAVRMLIEMGRGEEALALARAGIEAIPGSGQTRLIYGMTLSGQGRQREALRYLREAQLLFGADGNEVRRVEGLIAALRAAAPDSLRHLFRSDSLAHPSRR